MTRISTPAERRSRNLSHYLDNSLLEKDLLSEFHDRISTISHLDEEAEARAGKHLDALTKPPGSLGKLEQIAIQLAGISRELMPNLGKKAIVVMAGDHGVCEERVSAYPQEVTAQMVLNFLNGGAAVNVLAKHAGAEVVCVDIGVKGELSHPGLVSAKVRKGTGNLRREPAMTKAETLRALLIGMKLADELADEGYGLLGTGEMGIGNTTSSSAILAVLAGIPLEEAVGKGTGIDERQLAHKRDVIRAAIELHGFQIGEIAHLSGEDAKVSEHGAMALQEHALEVLQKLGGLEIAGLTGVILGAAARRVPVVIDGFISTAAALAASRLHPLARGYMIPSHLSAEPGHLRMMKAAELEPILQMDMRLGEGTGAALAFPIVESAVKIMAEMATFESAGIAGKKS